MSIYPVVLAHAFMKLTRISRCIEILFLKFWRLNYFYYNFKLDIRWHIIFHSARGICAASLSRHTIQITTLFDRENNEICIFPWSTPCSTDNGKEWSRVYPPHSKRHFKAKQMSGSAIRGRWLPRGLQRRPHLRRRRIMLLQCENKFQSDMPNVNTTTLRI